MQAINSAADLKEAIQSLELEQALQASLLKEQFRLTLESLKPVNLLKGTMNNILSPPNLMETILGISLGLATGFFTNKLIVSGSGKLLRSLIGPALQGGVASLSAHHPGVLKSVGHFFSHHVSHKKERQTEKP
jgi:hypothetical protein